MKKNGFTLTELLITLGIVGIITALTIPSLATSVQKKYWANALASQITDFENAVSNMMIKENAENIFETIFYDFNAPEDKIIEEIECLESFSDGGAKLQDYYNGKLFKIDKTNAYFSFYPVSYNLKNGGKIYYILRYSTYYPYYKYTEEESIQKGTYRTNPVEIFIDVNGDNLPNTLGRDIFHFDLDENGKLHAQGSKEYALFYENDSYWQKACSNANRGDGLSCTGRLVENNFVMDY